MWGQESLILFLVSGAAEGRKVLEHPRAKSHPFTLPLVRVSGFEITPKSFATEGKIMAADALTPFLSFPSPLSTRPAHTPFNLQVSRCFVIIFSKSSSQSASYLYRWKQFWFVPSAHWQKKNVKLFSETGTRRLWPNQLSGLHILKKKIYYF